jgi:hypothetical protein
MHKDRSPAAPLPAGQPASCPEIEIAASKLGDFEDPGSHRVGLPTSARLEFIRVYA